MILINTRRTTTIAVIAFATLLASGCSARTGPHQNSSRATPPPSRMTADQAPSESLAIVEQLRGLNQSAIPELRRPTATECGPRSDEGVKFSWSVEGAPPADARSYIDQAEAVLKENGYSTHQTTTSLNDDRPLHFVGANGEGRSTIGLSGSAMNTVLQLSSACAEGTANDYS